MLMQLNFLKQWDGKLNMKKKYWYLIILGIEIVSTWIYGILTIFTPANPKFLAVGIGIIVFTGIVIILKIIYDYKAKYPSIQFLYIDFLGVLLFPIGLFFALQSPVKIHINEFDLSLSENSNYLQYIDDADDFNLIEPKIPERWESILLGDLSPNKTHMVVYGRITKQRGTPVQRIYIYSFDDMKFLEQYQPSRDIYKLIWATDTQILAFAYYDSDNPESTEHPGYVYVIDVE
jgi:hypothetical protein